MHSRNRIPIFEMTAIKIEEYFEIYVEGSSRLFCFNHTYVV